MVPGQLSSWELLESLLYLLYNIVIKLDPLLRKQNRGSDSSSVYSGFEELNWFPGSAMGFCSGHFHQYGRTVGDGLGSTAHSIQYRFLNPSVPVRS